MSWSDLVARVRANPEVMKGILDLTVVPVPPDLSALPVGRRAADLGIPWDVARVRQALAELVEEDAEWHPDYEWEPAFWLNPHVRRSRRPLDHLAQNPALIWSDGMADLAPWDWSLLSRNPGLPWSPAFLQQYADRLDWARVSVNPAVPWDGELVRRFADRVDFAALSSNEGPFWTSGLLSAWRPRLVDANLAGNRALPWDESLVLDLAGRVRLRILEGNPGIRWTTGLVTRLQPQLAKVADRGSFAEDALRAFADRLPWGALSANRHLPWSPGLIREHEVRWDWELLAANPALPWTVELLGAWSGRWALRGLARNRAAALIVAQGLG